MDNLIATARSNKVAVCLGFQDFSQLVRDYGDMEAKVQENYNRIKDEVKQIVKDELERIARDESLKHLMQNK